MNMNQEELTNKINILADTSVNYMIKYGERGGIFSSNKTQTDYILYPTNLPLITPILRVHNILLTQAVLNADTIELADPFAILLDHLSQARLSESSLSPAFRISLANVYTDDVAKLTNDMLATGNYEYISKNNKGIKEIFTDNIFNGTTEYPTTTGRDFVELELLKNKECNELILITNYTLNKRFQNKVGLLYNGSRPSDCNFLIMLGLAPAFIPELKDILTPQEKEFFKLLTTVTKLYHERNSAILYAQIIGTEVYNNIIKGQRIEKLRQQFRIQEERMFSRNISEKQHIVENLTNQLQQAEELLVTAQKEMAYYVAGDSKLEDAVSYRFEHSYLQAFNYNQNVLDLTFRVPLSQWDTDLADTILRGLKQDSSRYEIDRAYISDIEKFLQNVIIDQKAKYWLIARFNIDLNNFNWQGIKYYWNNHNFYPDDLVVAKAGLNPHLEYFTCVGSYRAQIEGAKQRKDLPGMIESLLAPYKNWNISDGAVSSKMFSQLLPTLIRYEIPCLEYKGEMLSIRETNRRIEEDSRPKEEPVPAPKKRTRKKKIETNPDDAADAARYEAETITVDRTRNFNAYNPRDVDELEEALRTQAEVQGGEDNDN